MAQTINTVIVLRNDQTTNWESSEYRLLPGEIGIGYLANGNVIAKLGTDGKTAWKDLPQIEGVFEDEITLTHNFGRYKTNNGFVKTTDAVGKTTSQWLIHALSETKEPTITQPTFSLSASGTPSKAEIGEVITALSWNATATYGKYEYGPATGLSASNLTWNISNSVDTTTSTAVKSSFTLASEKQITLDTEGTKTYATITGAYSLNASGATTPVNNVGAPTSGKITDKTGTKTANVDVTAYRKPFYGVLTPDKVVDVTALSSDVIRALPSYGTDTNALPTALAVPAGTQMVIFAAKAGTFSTLTATDDKAMNAGVDFTKVAKAVKVKGANGFATTDAPDGVDYDIWYVDWQAGIGAAKQLTLVWA